jgi:hypothetical protein
MESIIEARRKTDEARCKTKRFFLGPDWRTQLADELARSGRQPRTGQYDQLVCRTAEYRRRYGSVADCPSAVEPRYQAIAEAEAAWNDRPIREHVQLLVLANCDQDEIATRLGLSIEVVRTIEGLRFDVRPMLDCVLWVVSKAIGGVGADVDAGFVSRKRMAYFGGPHAVRALLDANETVPLEPAEQVSLATVALFAKLQEILALPVTEERSVDFLKVVAEIRLGEQQIALEREKLTCRMKRWADRCEIARARIELERSRPPQRDDLAAPCPAAGPADSPE